MIKHEGFFSDPLVKKQDGWFKKNVYMDGPSNTQNNGMLGTKNVGSNQQQMEISYDYCNWFNLQQWGDIIRSPVSDLRPISEVSSLKRVM